jgi:beta-galactosidase
MQEKPRSTSPLNPFQCHRLFRAAAIVIGGLLLFQAGIAAHAASAELKRENNFDRDWRFLRADAPGAENANFNDSSWRTLDLPHDWSIEDLPPSETNGPSAAPSATPEPTNAPAPSGRGGRGRVNFAVIGPFSPESPGGKDTGFVLGGTGWYRKHFVLDEQTRGKRVSIEFDGVYMNSDVWLNGHALGNHPYGYTAFAYDLTEYLNPPGKENVIAVRVRNSGRNSRWYTGSGIYRHVRLTVTQPIHVTRWGTYVTTPEVSEGKAVVAVETTLRNDSDTDQMVQLTTQIVDSQGKRPIRPSPDSILGTLAGESTNVKLPARGETVVKRSISVARPDLWTPETPVLYKAVSRIAIGTAVTDEYQTPFGIRTLKYSVENGFQLNGKSVKLCGGCLHHDNGPLGSAAIDRAEERRVELMKANGYNAIRTSHNPPSSVFLDTCDRLGILVLDEAFDCWEEGKNPDDYGKYFKEWWQRDLDSMILRDRNHPCVILWSIGNEVPQRVKESGYVIAKQLCDEVHRLDPTRPVTEAICSPWDGRTWAATPTAFSFLDVGGYNYQPGQYERDHREFTNRIIVGTESYPRDFAQYWRGVENNSYVLGDFVWTAMDYLGEAGIGNARLDTDRGQTSWPWFNAWCGDLDLCGSKKPQSYYRDVVLGRSELEMFVHRPIPEGRRENVSAWGWPDELASWTWPDSEGKSMQVNVYARCDSVRLELNGKEIATREVTGNRWTTRFEVPYAPGELKAVGLKNGQPAVSKVLRTAGPAKKVRLSVDRATIRADRDDLAYVTAEITDADGNVAPNASNLVRFKLTGPGELAAVGSAAPNVPESFRQPQHTAFQGRCLAILRPQGPAGRMTLRAEADGLESATVVVETR